MSQDVDVDMESLEAFGERARAWIDAEPPRTRATRRSPITSCSSRSSTPASRASRSRRSTAAPGSRSSTRRCSSTPPREMGRRVPAGYMVSIGMMAATLLDHGSELLKQRHLPRMLRGDEEWMQLLSEPSGGSDMAGALTRLTRDGDSYILNGSKMWSSGAAQADYGLCLARTDWDAPKHRGLSTIAVPLKGTPGLTIEPIRAVTGVDGHFCTGVLRRHRAPRREPGRRGEPGLGGGAAAALPRAARDRRRRPRLRPRCGGRRRGGLRWARRPGAHRRRARTQRR